MTTKDLAYYNEHPEELPDDADALHDLMEELEAAPIEEAEPQDVENEAGEEPEEVDAPDAPEPEAHGDTDDKPELLAKDGKNIIPYTVLEKTRKDLSDKERQLREMQDELNQLRSGNSQNNDEEGASDDAGDQSPDEIDGMSELLEDYGDTPLATVAQKQQEKIEKLERDLQALSSERAKTEEKLMQEQVDNAIASNATLSKWQEKGGALWNLAILKDQELQNNPDWQTASLDERFNEVARSISEELGVTIDESVTKPDVSPKDIDTSSTPTPKSLSDIPTGNAPRQTSTEEIKNMSPHAIGHKFNSMTAEQQDAYLASIDG